VAGVGGRGAVATEHQTLRDGRSYHQMERQVSVHKQICITRKKERRSLLSSELAGRKENGNGFLPPSKHHKSRFMLTRRRNVPPMVSFLYLSCQW